MTSNLSAAPALWSVRRAAFQHVGSARPALDDISLDVPAGKLTAVLGPNGAGKSTLLSVLLGTCAVPRGTVTFGGRPLCDWSRSAFARTVGVVPQGEEFAFPLTVRALVEMGRYPHLGPWQRAARADRDAVDAALTRCELHALAERPFGTLSGGERQRARLARALAQIAAGAGSDVPSVCTALALDEPTAALDLAHEMAFFAMVRALAQAGTTVLLVTHNLNLAARYADHLVLLSAGRVVAVGTASEVVTAEAIAHVYGWPVSVRSFAEPGAHGGAPQVVPLDRFGALSGLSHTTTCLFST